MVKTESIGTTETTRKAINMIATKIREYFLKKSIIIKHIISQKNHYEPKANNLIIPFSID